MFLVLRFKSLKDIRVGDAMHMNKSQYLCKPVRSYATPPREAAQPGVADEGPRARDAAVNCNPLRATPGVNKFTTARPQRGPRARVRAVNPNPSLDWLALKSRGPRARISAEYHIPLDGFSARAEGLVFVLGNVVVFFF